jgi:AcrR family transcriptional regulator
LREAVNRGSLLRTVPYRPTERTEARKAATRERIVAAAIDQLAAGGYASASIQTVAQRAQVAVGTVYRHFDSKSALFAEAFRRAARRELDEFAAISVDDGRGSVERIGAAVEAWARRALAEPKRAYALLAEPVDPAVEQERLTFRRGYRDVLAQTMQQGIARGELAPHDTQTFSAALIGATAEALIGPLSTQTRPAGDEALIASLVSFCAGALPRQESYVS